MGQHRDERSVRLDQHDLDSPGVGGAHFPDHARQAAQQRWPRPVRALRLGLELTLEARSDLLSRERATVVKLDTFAQGERPHEPIARLVPARGERRLDLGAAVAPGHEGVEDLTRDERVRPLERGARLEGGRHAGSADPQLAADYLRRQRRVQAEGGGERERGADQKRHKRSQNGSDPTEHRRGHHRLYTWNPLFPPLVSRAREHPTFGYRTCSALEDGGTGEVTEWQGSHANGKNTENSTCQPAVSYLPTLTFFFAAAYTSSTRRMLVHERRTGGQVRRDGL